MEKPCKEWMGARYAKGYGARRYKGRTWRVHRLAWVLANGPIPPGMLVCHKCDNPPCYEITHLYLGTAAQNTRDMVERNRVAKRGHLPHAKLTEAEAQEIRSRYAVGGVTQAALANEFGVTQGAISHIIRKGQKTGRHRLDEERVAQIRAAAATGMTQAEIARTHGIGQSSVSEIIRGLTHHS